MVDIQSTTAETIGEGKRRRRKKEAGQKYNGLPITMGGHKQSKQIGPSISDRFA